MSPLCIDDGNKKIINYNNAGWKSCNDKGSFT